MGAVFICLFAQGQRNDCETHSSHGRFIQQILRVLLNGGTQHVRQEDNGEFRGLSLILV